MSAAAATAMTLLAIVAQDQVPLRAAPAATASVHAQLWQGELVEVRGQVQGQLQVYDHRLERAGYIRDTDARIVATNEADAPGLLAVLRFLRDAPGAESLGIAYAAAYLKAAPGSASSAEVFDALGTMAERLARGATQRPGKVDATAAHIEVATQYGVKFLSYSASKGPGTAESVQLCYDGDAFRHVLALEGARGDAKPTPDQRARAILALTRPECIDPALAPAARRAADQERADLLDRMDSASGALLAEPLANRLHLRRAGTWAAIAFEKSRVQEPPEAAARRAIDEFAAVDKAQLRDGDQADYAEAAVRVSVVRWAAQAAIPATTRLQVQLQPGESGQTCVHLIDRFARTPTTLAEHCTYGTVWPASAKAMPEGRGLALTVEPLDGWGELWVWHQEPDGWKFDVVTPESNAAGVGYVEWAGWSPAARGKILVVRATVAGGRLRRRFEVLRTDTLLAEKSANDPGQLAAFNLWSDVNWKQGTVSLR